MRTSEHCDVGDTVRFFTIAHGWMFGVVQKLVADPGRFIWACVDFAEYKGWRGYPAHGRRIPAFQLERVVA